MASKKSEIVPEKGPDGGAFSESLDLSLPEKKKKRKPGKSIILKEEKPSERVCEEDVGNDARFEDKEEYLHTYQQLLTRLMRLKHGTSPGENPPEGEGLEGYKPTPTRKLTLPLCSTIKVSKRRTAFINFGQICQCIKRSPTNVMIFFIEELGCPCVLDDRKRLLMRGIFRPCHMEKVLRSFLKKYVFCAACRSPHTILQKKGRLTFLTCDACEAWVTVPPLVVKHSTKRR